MGLDLFTLDLSGFGFLFEFFAVEAYPKVEHFGFGGFDGPFGVAEGGHQFLIGEFDDDGAGGDFATREHEALFDAAFAGGWDEEDFLRDESAEATHLAEHRAAFGRAEPECGGFDVGGGGFEPAEAKRCCANGGNSNNAQNHPADELLTSYTFALDVHDS